MKLGTLFIKDIKLTGSPIINLKVNFLKQNSCNQYCLLDLVHNYFAKSLVLIKTLVINKFKRKKNYFYKNYNYYKSPTYMCVNGCSSLSLESQILHAFRLQQFISSNFLGRTYKLEIAGYSRRACYNLNYKLLFLHLGNSFVDIRRLSSQFFFKIIKTRLLFLYSINALKLTSFVYNLLKLKTSSAYKKSGLVLFNSLQVLKKKRSKVF